MKNRSLVLVILSFLSFDVCTGQNPALFDNDEILEFTIKCDMKALMRDRDVESDYHQATITYQESIDVPLRIKTRGHFRKMSKNCQYPPILLNFVKFIHKIFMDDILFASAGGDELGFVLPVENRVFWCA
jgi:hypothetical protein